MNWIVIEGVKPYDGRYELDLDRTFNTHEWGWIKRLSGYLPLTFEQGIAGGDPELFTVFAAIAIRRTGRIDAREVPDVFERLAGQPFGETIRLETDELEEDEPDPSAPKTTASSPTSGDGSPTSSENSESAPNGIGTPDSAISAWDLTKSAS